jgi:hypothetical protein
MLLRAAKYKDREESRATPDNNGKETRQKLFTPTGRIQLDSTSGRTHSKCYSMRTARMFFP